MHIELLAKITRGFWLIDQDAAVGYVPSVVQMMQGDFSGFGESFEEKNEKRTRVSAVSPMSLQRSYDSYDQVPEGSIALIPVYDVLVKADYCGIPGTATLSQRIQEADEHPNIAGIVLMIDSPGGHVDGTESFANTIKNTSKPILGWVDGLAASAAYWATSQTNHVMLAGETSRVGSVGTMLSFWDATQIYEKMGYKRVEVYATASTEKNADFRELLKGNQERMVKVLDGLNDVFVAAVQDGRSELNHENALKGAMYQGQAAIDAGLADSIGTLEDAVLKVHELTKSQSTDATIRGEGKTMFKSFLSFFASFLGKALSGEAVTAEQIEQVNKKLEAEGISKVKLVNAETHDGLTAQVDALKAKLTAAVKAVSPDTADAEMESFDLPEAIQGLITESASKDGEIAKLKGEAKPPKSVQKQEEKADDLENEEADEPVEGSAEWELAQMRQSMQLK